MENENRITAEMIKKYFDQTRQRRYDLPRIFVFLEENIFKNYYITPNFDINDYKNFSRDFDLLLNTLPVSNRNLIIDKYGLYGGEPISYSDLAYRNNCGVNKMVADVRRSVAKLLPQTFYVDRLRNYFNFKSKHMPSETKQENISFILSVMKDLEQEDK